MVLLRVSALIPSGVFPQFRSPAKKGTERGNQQPVCQSRPRASIKSPKYYRSCWRSGHEPLLIAAFEQTS